MADHPRGLRHPSALSVGKTERILAEFEANWTDESFARLVRRASSLALDEMDRQRVLAEAVKIDLERRWTVGKKRLRLEAYLKACPELGNAQTVEPELILAEYQARQAAGASPNLTRFAERFPQQARELRRLVAEINASAPDHQSPQANLPTNSQSGSTMTGEAGFGLMRELPERFGKFRIIRRLGQGGMGSVYLAEDTRLRRNVALKVPHASQVSTPETRERFYREARAAAALDHPNICSVFDVNEIDGIHYIEMAHVEGQDLSERLAAGNRLDQREVAVMIGKLAKALDKAHNKGIIHRDLKPSNIRVKEDGEPVIMDFGLAKLYDDKDASLTRDGQSMGTPSYMAPEQASGESKSLTSACDIYSLGTVMYEMLTGRPPFEGPTTWAIMNQVINSEPQSPRERDPDIAPQLEAICLKAMSKRAEDRFPSMAEFGIAIGLFLRDTQRTNPTSMQGRGDTSRVASEEEDVLSELGAIRDRAHGRRAQPLLRKGPRRVIACGAGAVCALLAVIFVTTPRGTLRLEVNDPSIEVRIDNRTILLEDNHGATRQGQTRLQAQEHTLQVLIDGRLVPVGAQASVELNHERFELSVRAGEHRLAGNKFEIVRGETTVVTISLIPLDQPTREAHDLLSRIDPSKHGVAGPWKLEEGVLIAPAGVSRGMIEIPFDLPKHYKLTADVELEAGEGPIFGLLVGDRQCVVVIDGKDATTSGIDCIQGTDFDDNTTTFDGRLLTPRQTSKITCAVLHNNVEVVCDGRVVSRWGGQEEELALRPHWKVPNQKHLFLGCQRNGYRVTKLTLTTLDKSAPPLFQVESKPPLPKEPWSSKWIIASNSQPERILPWGQHVFGYFPGELPAPRYDGSRPVYEGPGQRSGFLCLHPGFNTPAVVRYSGNPTDQERLLHVVACSNIHGDFLLECYANGHKIGDLVLNGKSGWQTASFDLREADGPITELEVRNTRWKSYHFETCFIDEIYFLPSKSGESRNPAK